MVAFIGYGGACPDYGVGDARFVFWQRHSSFYFTVTLTVTDFRFSGIPVSAFFRIPEPGGRTSEIGNRNSEDGLRYPNRYRDTEEIHFGWRKLAQLR